MLPKVSIVYLTKNGGSLFQKSLESILSQQTDFDFEVIAVDSGSVDGSLEFMQQLQVAIYQIPSTEFNFGLTRDYGFSVARGEIVVPISQDVIPVGGDWLQRLVEPFADPDVAVVQGIDVPDFTTDLFYWERVRLFYYTRDVKKWMKAYKNVGLSFTACAIRRCIWEQHPLGRVEMSEDKVFQKKLFDAGCRIHRANDVLDFHSHVYDLQSLAKRCENEGLGWRAVGIRYTFLDMIMDMLNPLVAGALLHGVVTFRIKRISELLFPLVRPYAVYKGNNFGKKFVG